jgi:hypothetical protein
MEGFAQGCRFHGDVEMGERVAILIIGLEPENAAGYVPLSNIYVAGNWHLCENVDPLVPAAHLQEVENMVIAIPRKPRVVRIWFCSEITNSQ